MLVCINQIHMHTHAYIDIQPGNVDNCTVIDQICSFSCSLAYSYVWSIHIKKKGR